MSSVFGMWRQQQPATGATWPDYFRYRAQTAASPLLAAYYAAGVPDPQTPIGEVPLVALDMETTGLDPEQDGIVSLAIAPFTLTRIRLAERRYWVVHPRRPLLERSVTLHHITDSQVAQAPDLSAVLPELTRRLAGRIAVVHYRNIERRFLDKAVMVRLQEEWRFPVIDTMELEARRHRRHRQSRLRRLFGSPPALSLRLQDSRDRYGLPPYHGHNALLDALATAELLQAQVAHAYRPETPLESLWC